MKITIYKEWKDKAVILFFIVMFCLLYQLQLDNFLIPLSVAWLCISIYKIRYIKKSPYLTIIILFTLYTIIQFVVVSSVTQNGDLFKVFINGLTVLFYATTGLLTGEYLGEKGKTNAAIEAVALIGLYNSIINIYSWIAQTGGVVGRYNFHSIINMSVSANIGISVLGALLFFSGPFKKNYFNVIGFIVCASNAIIVITRMKQVTLVLYLLMFFWLYNRSEQAAGRRVQRVVGALIVVCFISLLLQDQLSTSLKLYSRLFDASNLDNIQRDLASLDAKNLFNKTCGFGIGYGGFNVFRENTILASPHGGFFSILSEEGMPGLILYFSLIIFGIRDCYINAFMSNNKGLIAVSVAVFLSLALFFMSNSCYFPPASEKFYYLECAIYWCFLGLLKSNTEVIKNE